MQANKQYQYIFVVLVVCALAILFFQVRQQAKLISHYEDVIIESKDKIDDLESAVEELQETVERLSSRIEDIEDMFPDRLPAYQPTLRRESSQHRQTIKEFVQWQQSKRNK